MIVIDTSVLSELMRPKPDERVAAWVDGVLPGEAVTTAITIGEIRHGLQRLPQGQRRARLEEIFGLLVAELDRDILPFDSEAAHHYGRIAFVRESAGRPIDPLDCMIAAVCASRGATLATRNERDFEGSGIDLVNPWNG